MGIKKKIIDTLLTDKDKEIITNEGNSKPSKNNKIGWGKAKSNNSIGWGNYRK